MNTARLARDLVIMGVITGVNIGLAVWAAAPQWAWINWIVAGFGLGLMAAMLLSAWARAGIGGGA